MDLYSRDRKIKGDLFAAIPLCFDLNTVDMLILRPVEENDCEVF